MYILLKNFREEELYVQEGSPNFKHREKNEVLSIDKHSTPHMFISALAAESRGLVPRSVVAWNSNISKYVKDGQDKKAVQMFWQMQVERINSDKITFVRVLKACIRLRLLEEGRRIHAQIIQYGLDSDVYVDSCLVDLYGKCLSIEDACNVLNRMQSLDMVVCSGIITGYVKCGQAKKALNLFHQMLREGAKLDSFIFVGVLKACASIRAVEEGRRVHALFIHKMRGKPGIIVENCLIDMFGKCESLEDSCSIFNKMPGHDLISWNAMIATYVKCENENKAVVLFQQMLLEGLEPDSVTFVSVLTACTRMQELEEGRRIHAHAIEKGYESDMFVQNCLLDMYAKCGSIEDACRVFNSSFKLDLVSWNAMILGYVKCGKAVEALELYRCMKWEKYEPDSITYVGIITACADARALQDGRRVHEQISNSGVKLNVFIGNCLIDMYSKCGSIVDAKSVFEGMETHDLVSWNTMLMAYVNAEHEDKALELFAQMQHSEVQPNSVTFMSLLNACASIAALEEGRFVHCLVIRNGCHSDAIVGHCLVNMYSKCGSIEDACRVFNSLPMHDVISWSAIIGGYAMNGLAKEALQKFDQMCRAKVDMDITTLVCVLSACSHAGFLDEGCYLFDSLSAIYGILPTADHFCCLVDLLGRRGRLVEAEKMIKTLVCQPDLSLWRALLGACRVHGNVEMAERIAKKVIELDPENASAYVLLSNIYAAAGKWSDKTNIQEMRMKERHAYKETGHRANMDRC
ncbi:hypothetical protein O6H91_11G035200 [Diphasiastrum complanatum]|uniref:Uncharacterized protein n=1 Tax=Diphasiastrum complanatum TaxID=34168 RepID=A0ACC2C809_DIPCM|nr:hypothetical protein O6H91_11G035200 [Diphasiastrum complanatum]